MPHTTIYQEILVDLFLAEKSRDNATYARWQVNSWLAQLVEHEVGWDLHENVAIIWSAQTSPGCKDPYLPDEQDADTGLLFGCCEHCD